MSAKVKMALLGRPVPELPVADVARAQQHYKDTLAVKLHGWMTVVDRGCVARRYGAEIFRKRESPFEPAVHWVFAEDIDASYRTGASGANIVDPLETKSWGMRQFTSRTSMEISSYFHHG